MSKKINSRGLRSKSGILDEICLNEQVNKTFKEKDEEAINESNRVGFALKQFSNILNSETIYFARKSKDVILPSKESENAGYDVYAYFVENEVVFNPHETKLIPTGLYSCVSENYALLGKERGTTGSIGLRCGAGVIDSGYRGEIFIALTNENDKPLIISKNVNKTQKLEDKILYPYSKGIAQLLLVPIPKSHVEEITVEKLQSIPSKRRTGALGSSGK